MREIIKKIRRKKRLKFIYSLPVTIILVQLLSLAPKFIENVYVPVVFRPISFLLRVGTFKLNFALGEILFWIAILWLMYSIIKGFYNLIQKNDFLDNMVGFWLNFFSLVTVLYMVFYVFWGLNYSRIPLSESANLPVEQVDDSSLAEICEILILESNGIRADLKEDTNGVLKLPYGHDYYLTQTHHGFHNIAKHYPNLTAKYLRSKKILMPKLFSFSGTGGVYNPFTGEANVNMSLPDPFLPAISCHEVAHQLGYAREDEASFIAYLAARAHPDPYFKYSGDVVAIRYCMNSLKKVNEVKYTELMNLMHDGVKRDFKAQQEFWANYDSWFNRSSKKVYNIYLKANKQKDGIKSYGKVTELIVAEHIRHNQAK